MSPLACSIAMRYWMRCVLWLLLRGLRWNIVDLRLRGKLDWIWHACHSSLFYVSVFLTLQVSCSERINAMHHFPLNLNTQCNNTYILTQCFRYSNEILSGLCNQIHELLLELGIKTRWFDSTDIVLQWMKSLGHKQYLILLRSILRSRLPFCLRMSEV